MFSTLSTSIDLPQLKNLHATCEFYKLLRNAYVDLFPRLIKIAVKMLKNELVAVAVAASHSLPLLLLLLSMPSHCVLLQPRASSSLLSTLHELPVRLSVCPAVLPSVCLSGYLSASDCLYWIDVCSQ